MEVQELKVAMTPKEYYLHLHNQLHGRNSIPIHAPFKKTIGESVPGLMKPILPFAIHCPYILLLNGYASEGFTVEYVPDWSQENLNLMLEQGPHNSAMCLQAIIQLIKEIEEKTEHKYAGIVKFGYLRKNLPKKLKLSPVAMIRHKSKLNRCILDLSFTLLYKGIKFPSLNDKKKQKGNS